MVKRILCVFMLLMCVNLSFAKPLTKVQKQEVLKQFIVFQTAVKNNDVKTVKAMIHFPQGEESYALPLLKASESDERNYGQLTSTLFDKYRTNAMKNLKFITYLKINPMNLTVSEYTKSNMTALDKKRKYYFYEDQNNYERSYHYYLQGKKRIKVESFMDNTYSASFYDNVLIVQKDTELNRLLPCDAGCGYNEMFEFKLINKKLKLVKIQAAG